MNLLSSYGRALFYRRDLRIVMETMQGIAVSVRQLFGIK